VLEIKHIRVLALAALVALGLASARAQEQTRAITNSCLDCHALLEDEPAKGFLDDIHHDRGLTCAACHGGDPTAEDMPDAMDPAKGFIGVPKRTQIPQLCARCHSDAAFMRTYDPSLRTDQLTQYRTSIHGQRLRRGDPNVAVCSDCHGIHRIRAASSPLSKVHPLQIPNTCAQCHSDREHMADYELPTDQLASYRASVHFRALEGGDLAAPTCATCHGNHGAAPPGVASVERVCGTCHVFQEQLFHQSPHATAWPELGLATCMTCHENHRVEEPSDARIGTGEDSFCVTCHFEGDAGWDAAARMHAGLTSLDAALQESDAILERVERAGMEVGEARVTQSSANEQLVKARVEIHAFDPTRIETTIEEGKKRAARAYAAGEEALEELAFRRKGLAASLLIIAFVVLSLWLLIKELERRKPLPEIPPSEFSSDD
jgi:hypothetical protein